MLKDISDWDHLGYGGKSTLEKEELRSPDRIQYIIKYPRPFEKGISWEDITELIAAEIGNIYGLEMMTVELVTRNGKRGCLLRDFVEQLDAKMNEEGGALLPQLLETYHELQESSFTGRELINAAFKMMTEFPYWDIMKVEFIHMQIFDILIGNQDRHPFNWQLLFLDGNKVKFSPIYDNGASLGFRFDDEHLLRMISDETKLNQYTNKTKVKAGLFEKRQVKAKDIILYIRDHFPEECKVSESLLISFDLDRYKHYIESLTIINETQKIWLTTIIPYRRNKILQWLGKEDINE
jgi:hypothetical protein